MSRNLLVMAVLAAMAWNHRAVAQTPGGLDEALKQAAATAKAVAEKLEFGGVRLGQFNAAGQDEQTGQAIAAVLANLLGPFAKPDAKVELAGKFAFVDQTSTDGRTKLRLLKIMLSLTNTSTLEEVKEFPPVTALVSDTATIARLVAFTGRLPDDNGAERNRELQQQRERPPTAVTGTKVKPDENSLIAVEILAGPPGHEAGTAPPARVAELTGKGQAFVAISPTEVFQMRVTNDHAHEIAVAVAVDGMSVFEFMKQRRPDGGPKFAHYIVGPKSTAVIPGWMKSADSHDAGNFAEFLVTEAGKGLASRFPTKSAGKVGTIHVAVSACVSSKNAGETTEGRPFHRDITEVQRKIDAPTEFVTIRYNR